MKSAITNQKIIIWAKKEIKRVTFDESSESSPVEPSVRVTVTTSNTTNASKTTISTLEEQQKEHTRLLNEIIKRLPEKKTATKI